MTPTELAILAPNAAVEALYAALTEVNQHKWAALTVPPFWVKKLRRDMGADHPTVLATVVGYPFGFQRTEAKQTETEWALKDGANEIQVVLNTSAWFSNSNGWPKIELAKLGKLIHQQEALFTVIIESTFFDEENFAAAAKVAADAGADFIQNGTGLFVNGLDLEAIKKQKLAVSSGLGFKIVAREIDLEDLPEMGIERVVVGR